MTTRTFEFSDGKSNKFWSITLEARSHAVNYGRIGTSGQTQTAEFPSEADAKKSYEKLIAEKLKKGYIEKSADGTSAAAAATTRKTPDTAPRKPAQDAASSSSGEAVPSPLRVDAIATSAAPALAGEYRARREIDLDNSAMAYLPSRRAALEPLAPAKPFDLQDCLSRLRTKVQLRSHGWEWDLTQAMPDTLAPQEAEFWLTVMTMERSNADGIEGVAKTLATRSFMGQLPQPLDLGSRFVTQYAVQCLAALLTPGELRELLLDSKASQSETINYYYHNAVRSGFRRFVLPHLDDAALAEWRAATRSAWSSAAWPTGHYAAPPLVFYFGALLGLHDEVRALVEQWPDNLYVDRSWDHTHYHRPQEVVYGLGSAELIAHHFRRLTLPTNTPWDIATFLALTDFRALDVIARSIAAIGKREDAEALFPAFARVHAPEAAPFFLELALTSKAPKLAREWLENNLDEAIVGLIPVAAGTGKLASAALDFLESVKRRGHSGRIEAHLGSAEPAVAAPVRAKVLDVVEEQLPILPLEATPTWWTAALAEIPLKKSKPISWALPAVLPPITIGEQALAPEHVAQLLGALQASTLEAPHPLVPAVREHAAPERLDAFGWKLFEGWLGDGAPPKEKWAFYAAGFLGGDTTAVKLAPMVREWPGESQHPRAVLGLEVLRTIGSDTALMQINGIAQKVKFKGLKERAMQCMEEIANRRGMTRSQLEDRIVPDCGLDARGERVFDFGPRQFCFVLGPALKPMIKYADGATKTDLPKAGAKDDTAKAEAAIADWKLLKKQVTDVAKIQAARLEQAMVTGRRWTSEEFAKLFVHHPLMIHFARCLTWATYGPNGAVTATFRVTEDQTLADSTDQPYTPPAAASIGILHPLQLAAEPHVLEQWGQLFGDYEIVPPFPQLGRPVHHLTSEQLTQKEIVQFKTRGKLAAQSLVFGLEKLGWQRGVPQDAGWVGEHSKQFYGGNVTAVINYDEGFSVGYWEGAGEQTIERVFFVPGLYTPQMYPEHKNAVRLADVDPIVRSEVLGDCELLLTKAK